MLFRFIKNPFAKNSPLNNFEKEIWTRAIKSIAIKRESDVFGKRKRLKLLFFSQRCFEKVMFLLWPQDFYDSCHLVPCHCFRIQMITTQWSHQWLMVGESAAEYFKVLLGDPSSHGGCSVVPFLVFSVHMAHISRLDMSSASSDIAAWSVKDLACPPAQHYLSFIGV